MSPFIEELENARSPSSESSDEFEESFNFAFLSLFFAIGFEVALSILKTLKFSTNESEEWVYVCEIDGWSHISLEKFEIEWSEFKFDRPPIKELFIRDSSIKELDGMKWSELKFSERYWSLKLGKIV